MNVIVPREDLDRVGKAREALYELLSDQLEQNPSMMIALTEITGPLWEVSNRRYPEATESSVQEDDR